MNKKYFDLQGGTSSDLVRSKPQKAAGQPHGLAACDPTKEVEETLKQGGTDHYRL